MFFPGIPLDPDRATTNPSARVLFDDIIRLPKYSCGSYVAKAEGTYSQDKQIEPGFRYSQELNEYITTEWN